MSADDSYAEVPYPTPPVRCTHPEILAVVGALSGLRPAPVDRCRVLEIGCGDGGNLLSMACGLPGAEFVGIEPSAPALARAADAAEALGVRNVRFERKGVEELDEPPGSMTTSSPTACSPGSLPTFRRRFSKSRPGCCGPTASRTSATTPSRDGTPGEWSAR
jgi:SAM-dependent methyltransferase